MVPTNRLPHRSESWIKITELENHLGWKSPPKSSSPTSTAKPTTRPCPCVCIPVKPGELKQKKSHKQTLFNNSINIKEWDKYINIFSETFSVARSNFPYFCIGFPSSSAGPWCFMEETSWVAASRSATHPASLTNHFMAFLPTSPTSC